MLWMISDFHNFFFLTYLNFHNILLFFQRYPVMWQGVLALKNDQCVVQLHMINGFEQLVKLSLPQQGPDGSVQPLRIAQRMRLEPAQLDGVIKRMKVTILNLRNIKELRNTIGMECSC